MSSTLATGLNNKEVHVTHLVQSGRRYLIAQLGVQRQSVKMKRGDTRKQKSIEFLIDVPIGSLKDEPENNSREWPGKRRLVAQIPAYMSLELLEYQI